MPTQGVNACPHVHCATPRIAARAGDAHALVAHAGATHGRVTRAGVARAHLPCIRACLCLVCAPLMPTMRSMVGMGV